MKIIPGTLGPEPSKSTHGTNQESGEQEVGGILESGNHLHRTPNQSPNRKYVEIPNPQSPPLNEARKNPNLTRFVGHLWRGTPTRSYISALRSSPTPVVRVMNRGGGNGARGQGGDGFGAGRFGRGDGRTAPKGNVWERKDKQTGSKQEFAPVEAQQEGKKVEEENQKGGDEKWDKQCKKEDQGCNTLVLSYLQIIHINTLMHHLH